MHSFKQNNKLAVRVGLVAGVLAACFASADAWAQRPTSFVQKVEVRGNQQVSVAVSLGDQQREAP